MRGIVSLIEVMFMKKQIRYSGIILFAIISILGFAIHNIFKSPRKQELMMDYVFYETAKELIDYADHIVKGTVVLEDKKLINGVPYGIYTLFVDQTYKGDQQEQIKFKKVLDQFDNVYVSKGEPPLHENVEYVLLLKMYDDNFATTIGTQGCYEIGKQVEGNIQVDDILQVLETENNQVRWVDLSFTKYMTNDELVAQADNIIKGTVKLNGYELIDHIPHAAYTLYVGEVYKGDLKGEVIIKTYTNQYENIHLSGDYPDMIESHEYLFLLRERNGYFTPLNGIQGYQSMEDADEILAIINK